MNTHQHQQPVDVIAEACSQAGEIRENLTIESAFALGRYDAAAQASAAASGTVDRQLAERLERDTCAALQKLRQAVARAQSSKLKAVPASPEAGNEPAGVHSYAATGTEARSTAEKAVDSYESHPSERLVRARRVVTWLDHVQYELSCHESESAGPPLEAQLGLLAIMEFVRRDLEAADPHFHQQR